MRPVDNIVCFYTSYNQEFQYTASVSRHIRLTSLYSAHELRLRERQGCWGWVQDNLMMTHGVYLSKDVGGMERWQIGLIRTLVPLKTVGERVLEEVKWTVRRWLSERSMLEIETWVEIQILTKFTGRVTERTWRLSWLKGGGEDQEKKCREK